MKKPTFSKFSHWLLFLFDNYFQANRFECFSSIKKELNSKGLFTQKKSSLSESKFALGILFFFFSAFVLAQTGTKFTARLTDGSGNKYLKVQGDIKVIGNTILTPKGKKLPFNDSGNNNELDAVYLDVDNDGSTFSSTSAGLAINNSCKKIVWAGLYWSAMYPNGASTDSNCFNCGTKAEDDWNQVKFKVPGATTYTTLTASKTDPKEVIFKGDGTNNFNNGVYVCFKDVTSLLKPLANADGTYFVANVRATTGIRRGGSAGGWTLVVIYESPTVSSKYISVFDGAQMTNVDNGVDKLLQVDIPISGFQTLPAPFPVQAKIGVAALDGDFSKEGDGLLFVNGFVSTSTPNSSFTPITNSSNPIPSSGTPPTPDYTKANFFNASITVDNAQVTNRNPTSTNNLGFDIDYLEIPNPSNVVIPNGATQGTYRMFTDTTGGDGYAAFLTTFAVDIIEPKILLTKEVYDNSSPPKNVGDKNVTLGQQLNYVIGFQNQGNDDATSFTITDKLPINTIFSYPSGIDATSLPAGVTHSYDSATRTITFNIPNNLVAVNGSRHEIRLNVKVVNSCNELSDACSNIIKNIALSDYTGFYNKGKFGDMSLSSYTACNIGIPQSTNFLVGVDNCKFNKNEVLCGNSVDIKASNGYSKYTWSNKPFDNNGNTTGTILGNAQTLTVTNPGVYYVYDTANAPCLSITEVVTVTRFGTIMSNPVIPFASEVVTCPNDGKLLPNIFLCGAKATKLIDTKISDGSTIVWEKLNEASCTAVTNSNCANESTSCTWSKVAEGASYAADNSGQFRLTLNYPGGCFNRFYFNVYKNELNPTETHRDIICNTKGNITIGGVPPGYEYSLDGINYKSSNIFDNIDVAGSYTVYIKQSGVKTNPCIFTIPDIIIRKRNFTVDQFITNPLCYGDKGSIKVAANDVRGPYTYEIFKNGTSLNKVTTDNAEYTFTGLDSGAYSYTVTTADGCTYTQYYVAIAESAGKIIATPSIKVPLTACSKGIIKIETSQDKNYSNTFSYFVNGSSTFQSSNEIEVSSSGPYTIRVVGKNNCEVTVTQQVDMLPKPTYQVTSSTTNLNCYGERAKINIALSGSSAGYKVEYSIDNGANYKEGTTTGIEFANLYAGTYNVLVRFSVTYPIKDSPYTETVVCPLDPATVITIGGSTSAVTASGGVGELAGCKTSATGEPLGLLRITNVEGGTPAYQYSFDGGNTWESTSEKYVPKGVYNLAVKDSKGCVFQIPYTVTLDPKPADPSIQDNINTVYNCDGTATATVIVDNPVTSGGTTYTYEYYMQKNQTGPIVPNTPISSNVFTNVPSGNHNVIVKYNVKTVSSYSNLLQEDFGRGDDTTSPGINNAYCWEKQDGNTLAFATCSLNDWHPWLMNDGDYVVTKALLSDHFNDFNWWLPKDHTSVLNNTPSINDGRFLAVNIGDKIPIGAVLYSKPINDVLANQDINVSLFMTNLLKTTNNLPSPQLEVRLVKNGELIASQVMPSIPRDEQWHSSTDLAGKLLTLNPGNNTSLDFQILSYSQVVTGNDLAIDDIHVYQIPKACGNERVVPIKVDGSKAFKASAPSFTNPKCSGDLNGTITIAAENFDATAGYQYNVDGESTFHTTTVSPLVLTGFGTGSHTIIVRNDASGTCSYTLTQVITAPTAMVATSSIVTQPTCTDGATIRASATGGSGVYQYELRTNDGLTAIPGYEFSAVTDFVNVPAGTYTVVVKDSNNCISPASEPVTITAPAPPTATLAPTSDLCYDTVNQAKLVVNVTGGKSPFTYTLDGSIIQNGNNTFTNVGSGSHTIVVTDSNNCTDTISNITIAPQLTLNVSLIQDLTCLVNASIGNPIIGGGNGGPYTYTVSGAATGTVTFPYTATAAGTYVFTATDSKGCTAASNTITVSSKTTPTLTFVKTDITCNNANNGTITITPANGFTSTYTYAYKLSSATNYLPTPNPITGLAAGTYNIKVIDSKGCESAVSNVTIVNPAVISGSIDGTLIGCSPTGTVPALITVTALGGTGTLQYSFNSASDFRPSNTYSTTTTGIVTAYVKDANNCQIGPLSFTVEAPEQFTSITITDTGWDCATTPAGGHVNIAGIGVSSPKKYSIISGPAGYDTAENSDGEFKGLAPGNYIFQARDTKTNCVLTRAYTITGIPDIVAGGSILTPIKCFGDQGTIQFTVNGAKDRGYDYVIKNAANIIIKSDTNIPETTTTISVPTQPAGVYTITVTDRKTKCQDDYALTLTQPTAALSITSANGTNVNCNNYSSQITVVAANGTPNYTYAFAKSPSTVPTSTYGSSATLTVPTNLGVDLVWDVYVKDANGCITSKKVTIVSDSGPTVKTPAPAPFCFTSPSSTVVDLSTFFNLGTGVHTYTVNGSAIVGNNYTITSNGTYTIVVKDVNNCTATATYVVAPQLTLIASKVVDVTCTANTTINLSANGGTGTYKYEVSNGGLYSTATNPYVTAIAGTYKFRVTDSASPACQSVSTDIVVNTKATVLTLTTSKVDVKCKGDNTGSITITPTSGKAPYTYSVTKGGLPISTTATTTGLVAGTYDIVITDALGCTSASTPVTINEPLVALSATATAPSTTTCSTSTIVTVTGHDGTAPYTYSLNGGAFTSTNTYVVNDNGADQTITYQVKDANGCITASQDITVKKLNKPIIASIIGTPIYCAPVASTTSKVTVTTTSGTGVAPLVYSILSGPVTNSSGASTGVFTGLTAGLYNFKVTDANGCSATQPFTVNSLTPIAISGQKISDVLCKGGNTGIAKYTVTGFSSTGNYTITTSPVVPIAQISNVGDVITLSNLTVGTYKVTVVDNTTACSAFADVIIGEPTMPLAATFTTVNANCNVTTSKVTVNVTAGTGTPGYTYAYKQDGDAPIATDFVSSNVANLNPTTNPSWDVWVKDANGCTIKLDVPITKDLVPTVTASVTNQCSASGSTFTIKAIGASGVGPYTYTINTGLVPSPADTFTVAAGTYTITVKDANGCTNTTSVIVNDAITANAILVKELTCSAPTDAKIDVTITGGVANFSYKIKYNGGAYGLANSFVGNTFSYSPTVAGTYQFEITDANGCIKQTNIITVNSIVNPVITGVVQTQSIKCNGDNAGIIRVDIDTTKGVGPFEYNINGGAYQSSNIFTGLTAGTYTVTVKDSKGCINVVPAGITIAQPNAITFDLTKVDITCNTATGSTLGSITVSNVLGGTASAATPFKYFITNNFGDVIAGNPYTAITTGREDHTFTIINYGIYTINAIDANGCSFAKQITIASPPTDLTIDVTTLASNCTSGGTAKVAVISAVGSNNYEFGILEFNTSPYTTTWIGPDTPGGNTATFTNLVPGVTYTFVVHDKTTQCYYVKAASQPILPASALTSTVTAHNVTCKGAHNGSVTFTLSGLDATTTSVDYQIFNAFSNVAVGAVANLPVTGAPPYTATLPSPGSLYPGQYYIKFIENGTGAFNGCKSASAIFEIIESSVALSITASVVKNENCNNLGIITALAKDGTAPYLYMITTSAAAPAASDPAWNSTSTFTKAAGDYYVHVKDANGCIQPSTVVNLIKDPSPVIALSVVNKCVAEGAFEVKVDLTTAGVAPYTVSVNGGAPQNVAAFPYSITGLNSGIQSIIVTDVNGCSSTKTITLTKKLSVQAIPTKDIDCSTLPNGVITLKVADGLFTSSDNISDFKYEVAINGASYGSPINFALDTRTVDYSVSAAGTYKFRITDLNGCQVESTVVTIDPKVDPTVTAKLTNPSCPTSSDGTITITATGGVPPYEYSINAGGNWQTSDTFPGLSEGTVNYLVRDTKLCEIPGYITLKDPVLLDASAIVTEFACNTSNVPQQALVTVNVTAGTGTAPYTYNFDGSTNYYGTNTFPVTDLAGQTVNYSVKDFNGCIFNGTASVKAYQPLTDITFALTKAPTCPTETSEVTLTVAGGYTPMAKYEIISPIIVDNGNDPLFIDLAPDTYLFKVTDANGCSIERPYTVKPLTKIDIVGAITSNISCNALNGTNNNGSATFTVTGFSATGNYSITTSPVIPAAQISNVGDIITLTGLPANTYTVTVKDNTTGCTKFDSVILTEPVDIKFTATASNVFCSQDISEITVSGVTGGTGVYSYAAVKAGSSTPTTFDTNPVIYVDTNLTDLSWDVYVKDANGCISVKVPTTVIRDAAPTIVVPAAQCFTGSQLTVNLSPNTLTTTYNGNKSYTVNGFDIVGSIATFNGPGTYKLGIKDDHGCEAFVDYTIEKQLLATPTLRKDLYCAAPIDAIIDVEIKDGVAPYKYQMYIGGIATGSLTSVTGTSFTESVSTAGSYTFVITDSNGATCSVTTDAVIVNSPSKPTFTSAHTDVVCNGESNGTITITPANGVAPYTFALSGTGSNNSGNTTGNYTGLPGGSYTVVVADAYGCISDVAPAINITDPAAVTASASVTPFGCDTANSPQDAIVTITAGGGTSGYTYSFNGGASFQDSPSFPVNVDGTISYKVLDANGCSVTGTAIVLPYSPPKDMDLTQSPIYCSTAGTVGTVTVNSVTGGVSPYVFEIISPATAVTAPSAPSAVPFSFVNLAPDTYIIKVTDANGCSTTKAIKVEEAAKISVTPQPIKDVSCKGDATGSASFLVSNYITAGNYTASLSPGAYTPTYNGDEISFTGLPTGTYTLTVTDGVSGCTASVVDFMIDEPAIALSSTSVATNIYCDKDESTVTITGHNGTGLYIYAIAKTGDPAPAPNTFVPNNSFVVDTNNGVDVNWTAYVMDANRCLANNAQPILTDAQPVITSVVATQCPSPTGTYDITVTATGFSSFLEYSLDGVSFQNSNVLTVNASGNYNVTVRDANRCLSTSFPVTILEPLTLSAVVTKVPTCNNADGEVTLTAQGGSIPASYEYSMDGTIYGPSNIFSGLAPNAVPYKFYVKDTGPAGCVKMIDFKIEPAVEVTGFALDKTDVTCNGGNNGTIIATIGASSPGVNDNPVYKYELSKTTGGVTTIVVPAKTSPVFNNLIAGDYTVKVISGRGCEKELNITIIQPDIIVVNVPIVTQFGCNAGTNAKNYATITVTSVTGGTPVSGVYANYEFYKNGVLVQDGLSNVYTVTNLSGGSDYTVIVHDKNGCSGSASVPTIDPYISLDKINVAFTPITCLDKETIKVTVDVTGGTPAAGTIKYTVTGINGTSYSDSNTTGDFSNLGVGFYTIAVENTITHCTTEIIHYVNEPNTFELQAVKISDVKCYGSNEGEVKLTFIDQIPTPTDEAGAFTYIVTGPSGVEPQLTSPSKELTLSNLIAGNYSVEATLIGSPYCPVTANFTIIQPNAPLDITETHTDITCIPGNDGSISVSATGGWVGDYQYQLLKNGVVEIRYGTSWEFNNLAAGNYRVNVKDSKGCVDFVDVELKNPTPLAIAITPSVATVNCYGDKSASVSVTTISGGQGSNYLYTLNYESMNPVISSGPQNTGVFTGLGKGKYSVTVTDGWGCSATSAIVIIDEPSIVEASLVLSKSQTCAPNSAELTLSASGGIAPYTYSNTANFATSTPIGTANSVTFPIGNGTFRYYVWDSKGCASIVSNDVQNDPLVPLTIDLDRQNAVVNCRGDFSGVIVAAAKGGLGNYTYTLLDSAGNAVSPQPAQSTPGRFDFLAAGTYSVKVESFDCSKIEGPVTISEPTTSLTSTVSILPVTCNGNGDGKIIVTASGGTGIIKYAIEPNMNQFFESGTFENLKPGKYDVIVQDQNGCFELLEDLEITEPTPIVATVDPSSIVQEYCAGDKTGAFTIAISGGVGPYSTILDDPKGTYVPVSDPANVAFSGLEGGVHTIYIKDVNTCPFELTVVLDKPVTLNPVASVNYDCVNDLPANKVTVTVDASNNPADVVYSLDNSNTTQTSNVFTNLTPGDHFIMAHHKNTCIDATAVFTIDQIDPLAISIDLGGLNEIVATVTGGSGVYHYSVNGEDIGTNNKYIYYHTGDYTVTVTDSNGCSISATKHFEFIDIEIPNVFTPNGNGTNDTWRPERTENYPDIQFVVYDRYGREVGKFGAGQGWDGKYKGNELPMGDYWYVLKLKNAKDDREFIGHFTLYR